MVQAWSAEWNANVLSRASIEMGRGRQTESVFASVGGDGMESEAGENFGELSELQDDDVGCHGQRGNPSCPGLLWLMVCCGIWTKLEGAGKG